MIRLVVAVALTVAILALAGPALEAGATYRTEATLGTDLDRFETAVSDLVTHEETLLAGPGPRRVIHLSLPAATMTRAPVDQLVIGAPLSGPGTGSLVRYRVRGGQPQFIAIPVPVVGPSGAPLVWRGPGEHTIVLTREGPPTDPVVRIREI